MADIDLDAIRELAAAHSRDLPFHVPGLADALEAAEQARDLNLRGLAEVAAQLTEQRERAEKAEAEVDRLQAAIEAVRALADDLGPAWWEWIAHPTATTRDAELDRLRASVAAVKALAGRWRKVRDEDRYVLGPDGAADRLLDDLDAALDEHLGEADPP